MRDLQRRLAAAGFPIGATTPAGVYCPATEAAVRAFQQHRGLRATGICDEESWTALVEANWALGDRLLLLTSPNLRGDDVGELQASLARLGFDAGRVDGIFGPKTARALEDFQSNCGLPADGVCGTETVRVLRRVIGQTGQGPGISAVRERERLREAPASLASLRIVVGQFGGLSSITRAASRELRLAGAQVVPLDEPDAVVQARTANQFEAHLYVGFEASPAEATVVHFYKVPTFESVGGRSLAACLTHELAACHLPVHEPCGMRLPVLRETRMPAVLVTLAPVREAVDAAPDVAARVVQAVRAWMHDCARVG
ncbi:MAG: peptidoglycan-binding protein [Acidimicrobiales bacterium]